MSRYRKCPECDKVLPLGTLASKVYCGPPCARKAAKRRARERENEA